MTRKPPADSLSTSVRPTPVERPRIAFGPELPSFGSWEWIGDEMSAALVNRFETARFHDAVPECDAAVIVKFRPELPELRKIASRTRIVFCPVDGYESGAEIDADEPILSLCQHVVVHCHRLARWFAPYAPVTYIDHHVRFSAPLRTDFRAEGPLLWIGSRSNLASVAEWVNRGKVRDEIWVLTNLENEQENLDPGDFGFRSGLRVRIGRWTPARHREWTVLARAAFDVKGNDFRQRHKPPVKAIDFVASGVPFATNSDSSPAEHLAELGFRVATPDNLEYWLSREYFEQTVRFGQSLAIELGRDHVAARWTELLESVIAEPLRSQKRVISSISKSHGRMESSLGKQRVRTKPSADATSIGNSSPRMKVAILSLLFNWPSTGGGTIHTYEAAKFLSRAGYDIKHFYARYEGWGVGRVTLPLASASQELTFDDTTWNDESIRRRFREAVDEFSPDVVIITDSWNTKPLLAEAVAGYRYFVRLAALECLCPLNNVRLLVGPDGRTTVCPRHQLESSQACHKCVARNGHLSGGLHKADRALAAFERSDYARRLEDVFALAEGILVVNPAIADMVRPFSQAVHVVPSGFDPERFSADRLEKCPPEADSPRFKLLFAGLVEEYMKGFSVLQEAAERLWTTRQDFEVLATGDPPGQQTDFIRFIGWQSQDDLPRWINAADILVFPTLAEEALGRSAVEAMACGRPVVASRIGGLPYTVRDGETGLLTEPGNPTDLAEKIDRLLDDADLRHRLGEAGRRRFEQEYTWDVIVDRHYRTLLGDPVQAH